MAMGTSMKKKFLNCDQQEEPDEGRLSRPVLWEGRGAIPPPDPIMGNGRTAEQPQTDTKPNYTKNDNKF
jgi:hypothetical protein